MAKDDLDQVAADQIRQLIRDANNKAIERMKKEQALPDDTVEIMHLIAQYMIDSTEDLDTKHEAIDHILQLDKDHLDEFLGILQGRLHSIIREHYGRKIHNILKGV